MGASSAHANMTYSWVLLTVSGRVVYTGRSAAVADAWLGRTLNRISAPCDSTQTKFKKLCFRSHFVRSQNTDWPDGSNFNIFAPPFKYHVGWRDRASNLFRD